MEICVDTDHPGPVHIPVTVQGCSSFLHLESLQIHEEDIWYFDEKDRPLHTRLI